MFWDLITDYGNKIIYSKTYYLANSFHTNILGSRAAGIGLTGNGIPYTTGSLLIGTDTIRKIVVVGTQLTGAIVAHPGTTRSLGDAERDAVVGRDDTAMLLGSSVGKGAAMTTCAATLRIRRITAELRRSVEKSFILFFIISEYYNQVFDDSSLRLSLQLCVSQQSCLYKEISILL